jgi:large subunit ribosomal protein L2
MRFKVLTIVQKKLRSRLLNKGGRGSSGNITVYHRGALKHRRVYRYINFIAPKNVEAVVLQVSYDPNRTARIALLYYLTGFCGYIIAAAGLKTGSTIFSGFLPTNIDEAFSVGSVLPLKLLPIGFVVHNIEFAPGQGAKGCRAGGTYATILKKLSSKVLLKFRSGWSM